MFQLHLFCTPLLLWWYVRCCTVCNLVSTYALVLSRSLHSACSNVRLTNVRKPLISIHGQCVRRSQEDQKNWKKNKTAKNKQTHWLFMCVHVWNDISFSCALTNARDNKQKNWMKSPIAIASEQTNKRKEEKKPHTRTQAHRQVEH